MGENSLYITLPSNTTNDMFPNNTISHFTVRLPKRIDFGDYEAALVEFQYPKTWTMIEGFIFTVMAFHADGRSGFRHVRIPPTRVNSPKALIEFLQSRVDDVAETREKYFFSYDEATGRTGVRCVDSLHMISLDPKLGELLGFEHKFAFRGDSDWHWSNHPTDISNGMTAIYIYSNIVQNQLVGDVMVPLLRTVPIRGKESDLFRSEEFRHHHYLPLKNETTDLV